MLKNIILRRYDLKAHHANYFLMVCEFTGDNFKDVAHQFSKYSYIFIPRIFGRNVYVLMLMVICLSTEIFSMPHSTRIDAVDRTNHSIHTLTQNALTMLVQLIVLLLVFIEVVVTLILIDSSLSMDICGQSV